MMAESTYAPVRIGTIVWTRYGRSGRQPGRIVRITPTAVRVVRFKGTSRRWNRTSTRLAPIHTLGIYDGPTLPDYWAD